MFIRYFAAADLSKGSPRNRKHDKGIRGYRKELEQSGHDNAIQIRSAPALV